MLKVANSFFLMYFRGNMACFDQMNKYVYEQTLGLLDLTLSEVYVTMFKVKPRVNVGLIFFTVLIQK